MSLLEFWAGFDLVTEKSAKYVNGIYESIVVVSRKIFFFVLVIKILYSAAESRFQDCN